MRVVVIGASAAGCFAALLLARAGHEVLVFEKERLEFAADVESAARLAFRATAPQIVQPHIIMARCRQLLIKQLPDVYENLRAAGVIEAPIATQMPATLADITPRPGDEQLTMLMTRRSTFDWVLQRSLLDQPGVTLRRGVAVMGLIAMAGEPPHIVGVRTSEGDLRTDLVIDAAGRRSPIDHWLKNIGARASASSWAECGVAYFSRHYRLREDIVPPAPPTTRSVEALDEFTVGIWGADNETMQLVVAPLAIDHRFKTLKHPEVFTAVVRSLSKYGEWLDALDPITGVYAMGGVHNTMRRLVVDGAPVATGLAAVGDSVCTTNPTLGRGLALALWGAWICGRPSTSTVMTGGRWRWRRMNSPPIMLSRSMRIRLRLTPRGCWYFVIASSALRHRRRRPRRPIESALRNCVRRRSSIRRHSARFGN